MHCILGSVARVSRSEFFSWDGLVLELVAQEHFDVCQLFCFYISAFGHGRKVDDVDDLVGIRVDVDDRPGVLGMVVSLSQDVDHARDRQ